MNRQLDRETLSKILQAEDIEAISPFELVRLFQEEEGLSNFLPDGVYQIDPRNGDRILYNSSRARRPHDNRPQPSVAPEPEQACVICQGRTTGIVDVADLSQGFTFINKNLFPMLYPFDKTRSSPRIGRPGQEPSTVAQSAYGFHFLQWTSSQHDKDWHNMPLSDCIVAMERLAALEGKLIAESGDFVPVAEKGERGLVLIMKNYGHLVGGSLAHGHQQIAFSTVMPRRMWDNWRFKEERGEPFSAYLLRENPPELAVKDYGPALLLVPYFMRRPFDMMLLLRETDRKHLHELSEREIAAVAEAWHDAIRVIRSIMPRIGREIAYNVITNNGPGAGLYFGFLPYTQEIGGAEQLGLFVCQQNPDDAAAHIRELLDQGGDSKL
jgi:galactose-1-phosphate uridylyltransferase